MNKFSNKVLIILGLCIVASCKSEVKLKTFSPIYENLLFPFSTKQITIFSCEEKTDTIIFYPVEEHLESIRHLERGFYDTYSKSVKYELTPGSYHYVMENSKSFFYSLTNNSYNDMTHVRLHFLELGYDEDGINAQIKTNPIIFDRTTARDSFTVININYCIKDFKFEQEKGIIEFTDCSGNKWDRK